MNALFARLYVLVIAATMFTITGVFFFVASRVLPERNQNLAEFLAPSLTEVARRIDRGEPDAFSQAQMHVGPHLALLAPEVLTLEPDDLRALKQGEIVVTGNELERFVYVWLPVREEALELELTGIQNRVTQWGGLPISGGLEARPFTGTLTDIQAARLAYRPIALTESQLAPAELVVFDSPSGPQVVHLDTDGPQDFRWYILAVLMLLMAVAIVLPLIPLHRQLHALGGTATALAEGDLEARVPIFAGGGPVHPVAEQFNTMAQRVEDVLQGNEQLLRSVAHEMRTPVARLLLALDLVEGDSDEARSDRVETMRQTAMEMRSLTDELLDFARLGDTQRELKRSPVDLRELADDAAARWPGTEVVHPEADATVSGDARLLMRALENCVGNAVRYASPPIVSVVANESNVVVSVDDDGDGIPEADWERVFDPFVRLEDSRSRETGGTGLGLAIVRRIARAHGGEAHIERSPKKGTRVVLTLPRS